MKPNLPWEFVYKHEVVIFKFYDAGLTDLSVLS